jgi:hypothetical protein
MNHTPYGYRIENGKAVIDEFAATQIKELFLAYLAGDSLTAAAQKAGIRTSHSVIRRMLQNTRYQGDDYYPAIIDPVIFEAVQAECIRRAEKLGRVHKPKIESEIIYPTTFCITEGTKQFDDPFEQAEYAYSLIESEM